MSVYDLNGDAISSVYDKGGDLLGSCYDKDGDSILDTELVVMSYNIQYFRELNADVDMQIAILDKYKPTILGMQEIGSGSMPPVGSQILSPRYKNIDLGSQANKTGIASNLKLLNVQYHAYENQASEIRGYNTAEFDFKGRRVFWINTHLATSSEEEIKVAQAGELFDLVQTKQTFIITGDFNTICESVSDTEYTTMIKQFVDAGYNVANCSAQHGFIDTYTWGKTLQDQWFPCDHIITSADFTMSDVERDTIKIAAAAEQNKEIDHVAFTCTLDFAD